MASEWVSSLIPLVSFLLFLFLFLKSRAVQKCADAYSQFPGPKELPLIGNLNIMLRTSLPHRLFRDLAAEYGPIFHLQLGELPFLIVTCRDMAKQLLTIQDANFANRFPNLTGEIVGYNYSDIVFSAYGDYWRYVRKIFTVEMLSAKRVLSFRPIRVEENRKMAEQIASSEGSPVDVSELVYNTSYATILRATIGSRTGTHKDITSTVKMIVKIAAGFTIAEFYPSVKWFDLLTGIRFKYLRMHRKLDKVISGIVEQHRLDKDSGSIEDMMDTLLEFQKNGGDYPLTDDNLKGLITGTFSAGSDTALTVIAWTMSHLIRSPSMMKRVQDEVRKVFDGSNGCIDEDKFHELEYLKLVIKETMRLHPSVTLLFRITTDQECELNGYKIPPKTRVMINTWAMGRDPNYWGDDAEKFRPERFIERSEVDIKGNHHEYLPFGAGRRSCPGLTFGMTNVEFMLSTLLYHFDWKPPGGIKCEDLDMTEEFGATTGRKNNLLLVPTLVRPIINH